MNVLDLFSGIGGFSLGLERAGMRTVAFCEIEPYARGVLAKHWPDVPCHGDITAREFAEGEADVICGGFPCQDISNAGDRAGLAGERSGLWRELLRAIRVVRPIYAIVENVAALLSRGMGTVLGDLAEIGQDAEWHCIPARALGAPHIRDRVWIVAADPTRGRHGLDGLGEALKRQLDYSGEDMADPYGCGGSEGQQAAAAMGYRDSPRASGGDVADAQGSRWDGQKPEVSASTSPRAPRGCGCECDLADAERIGCNEVVEPIIGGTPGEGPTNPSQHSGVSRWRRWWAIEPAVGRVAHGIPNRVDRLKGLGNAVVPQIPEAIGRAIMTNHTQG